MEWVVPGRTANAARRTAVALEVPTAATPDDPRQRICGRLEEMEREPMNVQVLVQETPRGSYLSLQDMDGVFVRVEPPDIEKEDEPSDVEREDEEAELGGANVEEVSALREAKLLPVLPLSCNAAMPCF